VVIPARVITATNPDTFLVIVPISKAEADERAAVEIASSAISPDI